VSLAVLSQSVEREYARKKVAKNNPNLILLILIFSSIDTVDELSLKSLNIIPT
jgi:hypothetical protein